MQLQEKPFFLTDEQTDWVKQQKEKLTAKQKCGQLFCVMGGDYPVEKLCAMVEEYGVGSVLYRPAPVKEIKEYFQMLDEAAPVPLLKAANIEEGGAGATTDGTLFGWPMLVGAADDEMCVKKFARVCAVEGRRTGINWSFSPVSDLSVNPLNPIVNVRSFGSDAERVKRCTGVFVEELQRLGIAACAKHFPGDGVDFRDQHLHPTVNSLSAGEWYESYGEVYRNMIEKGLASVMTGHILQPEVEMQKASSLQYRECLPGSQSRALLTGVLREEFGFHGVIVTDATIMGGFTQTMSRRDALVTAINAGADVLVFNTDFEEDYQYIYEAVEDGSISAERFDEALTRILALKAMLTQKEYPAEEIEAAEWHKECADRAVTLVKDKASYLPVTKEKYPLIRLILLGNDCMPDGSICKLASEYFKKEGFAVEVYEPEADDLHGTSKLPKGRLTLYLCNYETASNQTDVRIHWCKKHALDMPRFIHEEDSIFVSLANPYHLMDVPRIPVYINAYTATKDVLIAVLDKLTGKSDFKGKSPVDAFCGLQDTYL